MKTHNRKLNYVDLLLLAVLIIVIVIFAKVFFNDSSRVDFSQKETVTVTLRIKDIPVKHSGLIKNGDDVYFTDNEESFGVIKYAIYDSETVEFLDKLTNTSTTYKSPDRDTALVLLEALAENINGEYTISDKTIAKGYVLSAFVPSYSFEATVINIESNKGY